MADDRKDDTGRKLEEGFEELSDLSPKERVDIYERLASMAGGRLENVALRGFWKFRRENVEVSEDGTVVFRQPRVFLSHSHKDKKLARSIYNRLSDDGIRVWFDEAELRFGDSLISKLRSAIDSVDVLLALISKNSIDSEWVKKEIEIAMNQEIDSRRVKVIPLLCDPVELPGFLIGKLYADLQTAASRKKNLPKLVSDIRAHLEDGG